MPETSESSLPLKRKRELTEEEKEARKAAREKRAKLLVGMCYLMILIAQAEQQQRRNDLQEQRKAEREAKALQDKLRKWAQYGYTSLNVPLVEEDEDGNDVETDDEESDERDLEFVIGLLSRFARLLLQVMFPAPPSQPMVLLSLATLLMVGL